MNKCYATILSGQVMYARRRCNMRVGSLFTLSNNFEQQNVCHGRFPESKTKEFGS